MARARIVAPLAGSVVAIAVAPGRRVAAGEVVAIVESMKMEHEVRADAAGVVAAVRCTVGDVVAAGDEIALLGPEDLGATGEALSAQGTRRGEAVRADLAELRARAALLADASRPDAVAKRHALGLRTARENIADLCDPGSFVEYGGLAYAAQRRRRELEDLLRNTPADGMVTGIGTVNAASFGVERARTVVMAYDATVLAGTQGMRNHQKTDRLLAIAHAQRLPLVLFAEGGGGRPGDVDVPVVAGLHVPTFASFARLSGRVPIVAVVAGRCFAGNAALAGCSDVVIATRDSSIGMGGPAMVEGGGLGAFRPEEIGPSDVQSRSGVIDVLVADEAEAVAVARRYLAFFQGRIAARAEHDPTALRELLPENRLRSYDVWAIIAALADDGSTLELRAGFGVGIVTALARIGGRAVGVLANNPMHLGGAIDADAADKAARFLQLCDAHGLPVVSLIDTPGFMVGPEIETQAQVRHVSRMFVVGAQLSVPVVAIVVRKAYGLGAMAMAAGGMHTPLATVAWPSGEFGAMGLEGAVVLGYRKELAAAAEGADREALRARLVAEQYAKGRAIEMAATLEIDAVIDPADTRRWLAATLDAAAPTSGSGRFIDPW
ncbi:MAG: biotin carboxylase [Rhizobacter sp.]|nr:biotin carboxylase [Rhizobacter sp.]